MTTNPQISCEDAELYALGGLSEEEAAAFEVHLATCTDCQIRVHELRDVTDALLLAVEQTDPPAGMRDRVLAHVFEQPQEMVEAMPVADVPPPVVVSINQPPARTRITWQQRLFPVVSAVAVVALALLGWQNWHLSEANRQLAFENQMQNDQIEKFGRLLTTVALSPSEAGYKNVSAEAMLLSDGTQKYLMVKASNLPRAEDRKRYTLWVINKNTVVNGGNFQPIANGTGTIVFPVPLNQFDTIAVSLEPDAYSGDAPRGDVLMKGTVRL